MKRISTLLAAVLVSGGAWATSAPPVTYAIDSETAFAQWKSINSNEDECEFKYDTTKEGAVYTQNKKKAADD